MDIERTATSVPKRVLIGVILKAVPEETIRAAFHIAHDTLLQHRLDDFSKTTLLAFALKSPEGEKALKEAERNYPLSAPPTLYLVKVQHRPASDTLATQASELAEAGRNVATTFGGTSAIRAVYVGLMDQVVDLENSATEIPLLYERRVEYTVCEPESEDYGERIAVYSLERAFVWILEEYSHAVVCCSHFPAVRPILEFGHERLDFSWALPNLTEGMLKRLAADSAPRSATFSAFDIGTGGSFDVRTVTVSDPFLGERKSFQEAKEDECRQQTAGFYANHPNLAFGGLGIARRYGRIWTPAHVSRKTLAALATGLVEKTEQELSAEYERNPAGYVHYYRNLVVEIDGHRLRGKVRDAFDRLATAVLRTDQAPSGETQLDPSLVKDLVAYQTQLRLTCASEFECPQCGRLLGQCPACRGLYGVRLADNAIILECLDEKCGHRLSLDEGYECECGEVIPVTAVLNHVHMLPEPELLDGLRRFLDAMDDVNWQGIFVISGQILKALSSPKPVLKEQVRLGDLQLWRIRTHHHVRGVPTGSVLDSLTAVLKATKEKCNRNNGHPTHEICDECLNSNLTSEQVKAGDLCLPRLLGQAIEKEFDGIHHGHEIADIRYQDTLAETGQLVNIAIHLKSRGKSCPQGLGRSTRLIKALYTQLFYSAYLSLVGNVSFDVIGISVPNAIHPGVLNSMGRLATELGFSFLAIDETDWLRIVDAVLEQLEMAEPVSQPH